VEYALLRLVTIDEGRGRWVVNRSIVGEGVLMKYPVALTRTEEGFSVSCPGLPGCWSQGKTEEEALSNIKDAIQDYLAVAKQLAGDRDLREVEVSA
jgi:predicted RNase H-like HicB family nuclease